MSKKVIFTLFIIIVLAVMVFTCPNQQAHQDILTTRITNVVDDVLNEGHDQKIGMQLLSSFVTTPLVKSYIHNKLEVHNYFIFSTGVVHIDGKDQRVSLGIFNHIYTADEEELRNVLQKALEKSV